MGDGPRGKRIWLGPEPGVSARLIPDPSWFHWNAAQYRWECRWPAGTINGGPIYRVVGWIAEEAVADNPQALAFWLRYHFGLDLILWLL